VKAGADERPYVKVVISQGQIVLIYMKSENMIRKSGKLSTKSRRIGTFTWSVLTLHPALKGHNVVSKKI